eukprot:1885360-Rhodomonas_salina.1
MSGTDLEYAATRDQARADEPRPIASTDPIKLFTYFNFLKRARKTDADSLRCYYCGTEKGSEQRATSALETPSPHK